MGYSTSIQTLINMLPELELLRQGKPCVWTIKKGISPQKFAYKLREALYIAKLYRNQFPDLAELADRVRIETITTRQVQAVFREKFSTSVTQAVIPLDVTSDSYTASLIIEKITAEKGEGRFYFPEARLGKEELVKLYEWTEAHDLIFFVSQEGAITLQRSVPDLKEFAWSPEEDTSS